MKKNVLVQLLTVVLCSILIFIMILGLRRALDNLWVLAGISMLISVCFVLLNHIIAILYRGVGNVWNLGISRDVHQKLAAMISQNEEFKDIIIVAYTANSAYRLMEVFEQKKCRVGRLRLLLKNPVSLVEGTGKDAVIPNDKAQIEDRLRQMSAHLIGDIAKGRLGMGCAEKLEIKFYNSEPVLRGMSIDGKKGFFSIYTRRKGSQAIDYSATNSSVLRLSDDEGYEKKILLDFNEWFNLVWEYGSTTLSNDVLENILQR